MNKFFRQISSYFKNCRERKRKYIELAQEQEIELLFNVVEHNGNLYLTCGGNAVAKIEDNKTAKEIVESIKASRHAHKEYKQTKDHEPEQDA